MDIKITTNFNTIRIYINNVLFIMLLRDELLGIQSWSEYGEKWCIGFYLKGNSFVSEFDTKEKWLAVLDAIDKKLIL